MFTKHLEAPMVKLISANQIKGVNWINLLVPVWYVIITIWKVNGHVRTHPSIPGPLITFHRPLFLVLFKSGRRRANNGQSSEKNWVCVIYWIIRCPNTYRIIKPGMGRPEIVNLPQGNMFSLATRDSHINHMLGWLCLRFLPPLLSFISNISLLLSYYYLMYLFTHLTSVCVIIALRSPLLTGGER